ncbi:MAG: GTP 3',8-cyclase MoaA [Bordetella sp.]|nr:MAG: GTP 3',8-cyclase MoaA [Bordetella sp.]
MNQSIFPINFPHSKKLSKYKRLNVSVLDHSVLDKKSRPLNYLRISVLDQCNFRCPHCMPDEIFHKNYIFMKNENLLSFNEIARIVRIFSKLGVQKIRLTGGEPLLRKNIQELIKVLTCIRTPSGKPLDIGLTTNGSLLAQKAFILKKAGLRNITVSLDALDPKIFSKMIGKQKITPQTILNGIEIAKKAGLMPIKINMVVRHSINKTEILSMVKKFRHTGNILRFIEYMDVGNTNNWDLNEVIPTQEIINFIEKKYPLIALNDSNMGRVAKRWKYKDGGGEIGFISSITDAFCSGCTRARLSPDGKLFTCLFSSKGYDLRSDLRNQNLSDEDLANIWSKIWKLRQDNYSEKRNVIRNFSNPDQKIEMSYIGG